MNVELPANTWVDLYTATGFTVGNILEVENITPNDARVVSKTNSVSVSNLTIAGGVATATVASTADMLTGDLLGIAGAVNTETDDELNGDKIITVENGTQFSYPSTSADQVATGTITTITYPTARDDHLPVIFRSKCVQNETGAPGAWALCVGGGAVNVTDLGV